MSKRAVTIRGIRYASMSAAARSLGLKPNTLHKAKKEGRLDRVGKREGYPTRVELNGISFKTVNDAARYFGVHRTVITRVLNKGENTYTPKGIKIEIGRMTYDSISAAAKALGVSRHTIRKHVDNNTLGSLAPAKAQRTTCMSCEKPVEVGRYLCNDCKKRSSDLRDY